MLDHYPGLETACFDRVVDHIFLQSAGCDDGKKITESCHMGHCISYGYYFTKNCLERCFNRDPLIRFRRDKGVGGSGTPNSASSDLVGVSGRDLERGSGERSDSEVAGTTEALKVNGRRSLRKMLIEFVIKVGKIFNFTRISMTASIHANILLSRW